MCLNYTKMQIDYNKIGVNYRKCVYITPNMCILRQKKFCIPVWKKCFWSKRKKVSVNYNKVSVNYYRVCVNYRKCV
jgi:hypothetical protein